MRVKLFFRSTLDYCRHPVSPPNMPPGLDVGTAFLIAAGPPRRPPSAPPLPPPPPPNELTTPPTAPPVCCCELPSGVLVCVKPPTPNTLTGAVTIPPSVPGIDVILLVVSSRLSFNKLGTVLRILSIPGNLHTAD